MDKIDYVRTEGKKMVLKEEVGFLKNARDMDLPETISKLIRGIKWAKMGM